MTATLPRAVGADDAEIAALKRPFRAAVVGVVIGFVLIGGLIAVFGTGRDRASGIGERWLASVSETTRDGLGDDAAQQVAAHGDPALVPFLVPAGVDYEGKSAFTSLEVGKEVSADGVARVPYLVRVRNQQAASEEQRGVLVLTRVDDAWFVSSLAPPSAAEKVPSDGGPPVTEAPPALYVGGLAVGVLITLGCVFVIRRASR